MSDSAPLPVGGDENQRTKRWWRFAVLRGTGITAEMNGRWYDLDRLAEEGPLIADPYVTLEATDRWEQREDGQVAVVYEWTRRAF